MRVVLLAFFVLMILPAPRSTRRLSLFPYTTLFRSGLVVLQQGHGHHEVGKILAAGRVGNVGDVFGKLYGIEEARNGSPFLGFLVDHQRRAHATVRVATAGE